MDEIKSSCTFPMWEDRIRSTFSRRDLLRGSLAASAAIGLGGLLEACGSSSGNSPTPARAANEKPVRGGRLRVALVGNGTAETLDPNAYAADVDYCRGQALYDQLTILLPDGSAGMGLAVGFEPNSDGTMWTVRLRPGVTFHDGSPFTADDVIYTLQYINNPKNASVLKTFARFIDTENLKGSGLVVQMPMVQKVGDLPILLANGGFEIWKAGTTDFSRPNGTGAFMYKEFVPGTSSLFVRNPNWWKGGGQPYVDKLEVLSIPDATSRLEALLQGSVDVIPTLAFPQVDQYRSTKSFQFLIAEPSAACVPLYMDCKRPPFTDVRVRQAFRLIVDRPQMVEIAQLGYGHVANDLYGRGLPLYDSSLPQRAQDIDQAKSLLRAAGQEGMSITLNATTLAPGMLESAQLFAQQAARAGVHVSVNNVPASSFYSSVYLKVPFSQDYWGGSPISLFTLATLVTGATFPETDFGSPSFDSMVYAAFGETNASKAAVLWDDVQSVLWNTGGYVFWGTQPYIDGLGLDVRGAVPSPYNELSNFHFETYWLA
jgi:peptide/nickel transport system substrate-binding protein